MQLLATQSSKLSVNKVDDLDSSVRHSATAQHHHMIIITLEEETYSTTIIINISVRMTIAYVE